MVLPNTVVITKYLLLIPSIAVISVGAEKNSWIYSIGLLARENVGGKKHK